MTKALGQMKARIIAIRSCIEPNLFYKQASDECKIAWWKGLADGILNLPLDFPASASEGGHRALNRHYSFGRDRGERLRGHLTRLSNFKNTRKP